MQPNETLFHIMFSQNMEINGTLLILNHIHFDCSNVRLVQVCRVIKHIFQHGAWNGQLEEKSSRNAERLDKPWKPWNKMPKVPHSEWTGHFRHATVWINTTVINSPILSEPGSKGTAAFLTKHVEWPRKTYETLIIIVCRAPKFHHIVFKMLAELRFDVKGFDEQM